MLSNAITLAALTSAGFFMIYKKLPRNARRLILKYDLISDVLALLATYIIFGGTVTALIAAALVSVVMSMMLHIANHPSDYIWLTETIRVVKSYIVAGQEQIKQLNIKYMEARGITLDPSPPEADAPAAA